MEKVSEKSVKLKNLKPWKKGQSGNPKGGPKKVFTQIIDEIKYNGGEVVSKGMIIEAYSLLFSLTEDQLKTIEKDQNKPMTIRVIAKNMLSPEKGFSIFEQMLNRVHGTAKQNIQSDISGSFTLAGALLHLSKIEQKSEV